MSEYADEEGGLTVDMKESHDQLEREVQEALERHFSRVDLSGIADGWVLGYQTSGIQDGEVGSSIGFLRSCSPALAIGICHTVIRWNDEQQDCPHNHDDD